MVNWQSVQEMEKERTICINVIHALLGLYAWEIVISIGFDWDIILRCRRFRWPMCFYFLARYVMLLALISVVMQFYPTQMEINCEALLRFSEVTSGIALSMASVNLALRTIMVWSHNKYVTSAMVFLSVVQFGLCVQGAWIEAEWQRGIGCVITSANSHLEGAMYCFTMVFDLIALILNIWKLAFPALPGMQRSALVKLIFRDGLVYFAIAFTVNSVNTVFVFLQLNAVMSTMFGLPATTISTIVACRAVRRLQNFLVNGADTNQTRHPSNILANTDSLHATKDLQLPSGVHITMETIMTSTHDIQRSKAHELQDKAIDSVDGSHHSLA